MTGRCSHCAAKTFIIAWDGREYCREHFLLVTPDVRQEWLPTSRGGTAPERK